MRWGLSNANSCGRNGGRGSGACVDAPLKRHWMVEIVGATMLESTVLTCYSACATQYSTATRHGTTCDNQLDMCEWVTEGMAVDDSRAAVDFAVCCLPDLVLDRVHVPSAFETEPHYFFPSPLSSF